MHNAQLEGKQFFLLEKLNSLCHEISGEISILLCYKRKKNFLNLVLLEMKYEQRLTVMHWKYQFIHEFVRIIFVYDNGCLSIIRNSQIMNKRKSSIVYLLSQSNHCFCHQFYLIFSVIIKVDGIFGLTVSCVEFNVISFFDDSFLPCCVWHSILMYFDLYFHWYVQKCLVPNPVLSDSISSVKVKQCFRSR